MTAELLDPVVQHHIVNSLGWPALRPLQQEAVEPVMRGDDALLLAPTAGGKTEAATFPLLSRMAQEDWRGLTVLYVCPLRALLNNLEPRLAGYASWLGRRVGLWHGDTPDSVRRKLTIDRPDILLTTPESLESMLVSTRIDSAQLFGDLRAVVVDEVHAFAGDDRGWHLLAVLERLSQVAGRPLQRIGLSATVGNPDALLSWLQGPGRSTREATVVSPPAAPGPTPELELDYVGSIDNAATVIAALHAGEKRLVFADSRRTVESLAAALLYRGTTTFVSHSSLSVDERRQAEKAFAEARNCVIVSTSTLELGIDVGDLDRVLQVGAPRTVASLLQRLGRTGRRAGTARSMLFLATDDDELLRAAGLLQLWSEGYVEPILPPASPRQLLGQQLLALCLQQGRVGRESWLSELGGLDFAAPDEARRITDWMLESGHVDQDSGMLFVGPEAERRYGQKHFLELLSAFTADPQFTLLNGRVEVGTVDPLVMTRKVEGPRVLSLGGRPWQVTYIDWKRRRAFVEPTTLPGTSRWAGMAQPLSFALTDAMRRVALGADMPGVSLTRRATDRLATVREEVLPTAAAGSSLVRPHDGGQVRWWTWAGGRANGTLAAALTQVKSGLVDELDRYDNRYIKLRGDATPGAVRDAVGEVRRRFGDDLTEVQLTVSDEALKQLKFADLLPPELASATLGQRSADRDGASQVLRRPVS
ncbi:DEAD/DEAH box helicase [Modestobacter sp. VKM Ac-2985]|uniref:DEAD/DEAH box helicase n=1 Tax=Modestobacter sp. VKM Ac-2985 TaxID=3004139 RepID=UPI0022ABC049|nr:DEAD/DEAH box helicase [Modestobacter sp. VKM Ac-2985]MCZ2839920.1 DEAD/DEAH box helicase [Modestobacter sp. VKM Ac-2985]